VVTSDGESTGLGARGGVVGATSRQAGV
jgi:hypothetical protein